jgi:DNA-binding transcriptional LysR family regulator
MRAGDHVQRRLKLHDLRVLMTVAQAGSMLKAAQRLNTSQPAVSRSIAELEHALGVRLLDRSRQGVEPTIHGRALLDCGTAVFDDLRQGIKNLEFLTDPTEGELRIGGDFPGVAGVIPAAISRFRRKHPRIDIQVTLINEVRQQHRALRERTLELMFGRLTQPSEKDLEVETLFQEGLVVVTGVSSRWARRRKIELAELAGESWLLPTADSVIGSLVIHALRASGLDFPPKGVVTGAALHMHSLIASGESLAFFPSSLVRLGTMGLGLKILPVNLPIPSSPVGIFRLKNRTPSHLAQLFIACAREVTKPLAHRK